MYKIDLLRQIEANTRGGAVSDCYSKYDLWRMIERNTRTEKPVLPPYQLDNGTWDMTNRELVSFSRSTKAWLDGKEYAPDEPRYTKGGELLVEGQATNLMHKSEYSYTKDVMIAKPNGAVIAPSVADSTSTFILLATSEAKFKIRFGDVTDHNSVTQIVTLKPNIEQVISLTVGDYVGSNAIYPYDFRFDGSVTPDNLTVKLQVENGTVATSYIPTTTTAVTRAADIATVRDTQ